jgi:hypothetical protein
MTTVTVAKRPDGSYNILVGRKLQHESVERRDLEKFLSRYMGKDLCDDLMRQLANQGTTTVEIPFERGEQVK